MAHREARIRCSLVSRYEYSAGWSTHSVILSNCQSGIHQHQQHDRGVIPSTTMIKGGMNRAQRRESERE